VLAEKVGPLRSSSDDLFGHILDIGKRFAVSLGSDRRESLIVSQYQTMGAKREGVSAPKLLIKSHRAFAHTGVIGLNGRPIVAEFGVETTAREHPPLLSEPVTDG